LLGLSAALNKSGVKMKLASTIAILLSLLASVSCAQSPYQHRKEGLALGALVGALTGGAIGENNGETAAGAAIGAVVGGLTGAAIGDSVDQDIAYNRAVTQQQMNAQLARAVSVNDVIAMSQAGLSESVIVTDIMSNGVAYRPQRIDLITMSNARVGDAVIRAMQTAPLATAPPAPAPVYRNNVVVERYHYVAPPVVYPSWHHGHYRPHPHYRQPGVHWGFSFSR
jgi:hypothetical protein